MPRRRDGSKNLCLGDLVVDVHFEYSAGSPPTQTHPGDPSEVSITAVYYEDADLGLDNIAPAKLEAWATEIGESLDEDPYEEEEPELGRDER